MAASNLDRRIEQMFPTLTNAQFERLEAHGTRRDTTVQFVHRALRDLAGMATRHAIAAD